MKGMQRIISGWLAICMVLSVLPMQTFATETETTVETIAAETVPEETVAETTTPTEAPPAHTEAEPEPTEEPTVPSEAETEPTTVPTEEPITPPETETEPTENLTVPTEAATEPFDGTTEESFFNTVISFPAAYVSTTGNLQYDTSKLKGNAAEDLVNIALSFEGQTGAQLGYSTEWCAYFVRDCAILAGISSDIIPLKPAVKDLESKIKELGGTVTTNDPAPGDICFIKWASNGNRHVEIVWKVSGDIVHTIGGNSGNGSHYSTRSVKKHEFNKTNSQITSIIRPNYKAACDNHTKSDEKGFCINCGEKIAWTLEKKAAGIYTVIDDFTPRSEPYDKTDWMDESFSKGSKVTVLGSLVNGRGNLWYQVTWGNNEIGYVYHDQIEYLSGPITIKYDANGGSGAPSSQTKIWGTSLTLSSTKPTKSGYTFQGWSTRSTATSATYAAGGEYAVNTSVTLYAVWKAKEETQNFSIHLNANGGNYANTTINVTKSNSIGTLPTPTFPGMNFVGWYTEPYGGTKVTSSTVPTGDMQLFAQYEYEYRVGFDSNGGSISGTFHLDKLDGVNRGRPGETLVAFNQSGETVNTNIYGVEIAVNSSGKITAVREYGDENKLTVPNGGFVLSGQAGWDESTSSHVGGCNFVWTVRDMTGDVYVGIDYKTGEVFATDSYDVYLMLSKMGGVGETLGDLPTPVRDGYTFDGWYTSATGGSRVDSNYVVSSSMCVYAHWEKISSKYTLTYHYGINETKSDSYEVDAGDVMVTSVPYAFGYNCLGWSLSPTNLTVDCLPYENITIAEDTVLYAVWEIAPAIPSVKNAPQALVGRFVDPTERGYWHQFTADETGVYLFEISPTEGELQLSFYDDNGNLRGQGDIGEYSIKFSIDAGETVYLWTTCHGTSTPSSFIIAGAKVAYIYYDANGGSDAPENHEGFVGAKRNISDVVPVRDGYTFLGWSADQNASTAQCHAGDELIMSGDLTLYAVWKCEHSYGDWAQTKAPTCMDSGVERRDCKNCDHYETQTIQAKGHTEVTVTGKAATCTASGLTDGKKCSVCGTVTAAQQTIAAKGHTEVVDKAVAATCTATGLTEGKHCSVCGEILVAQTDVAKLGHDYKEITVKPTCTEHGKTTFTCSRCDDEYFTTALAKGHIEIIDKAVAATCTATGKTEGKHCSVCNAILVAQETIAALGHKWTAADCDTPKTCSVCKVTEGKALGHSYDDNVDGTCNSCGVNRETVEIRQVTHMLRMYNPYTGEHFYTGSEVEKDNLVAAGWKYEGVGFTFPGNTGAPVYRLYDPATGEHLYTMDEEEKATLMAEGWNYEGIAFNSAYDTEAVQHRLHNPYATVGAYHFTFSEEEKQNLINAGWEYQGIGWYSCWK